MWQDAQVTLFFLPSTQRIFSSQILNNSLIILYLYTMSFEHIHPNHSPQLFPNPSTNVTFPILEKTPLSPVSAACSRVCCYDIVFLFHESPWLPDVSELPAMHPGRSVLLFFFVKVPFPAVKFLTQKGKWRGHVH